MNAPGVASPAPLLDGRERCEGCEHWHGSTTEWINCLRASLARTRAEVKSLKEQIANDPDRARGIRVRAAVEEYRRFGGRP